MESRKILCKILDYIDENLGSKLTLQMLSDISGYSSAHLTRFFSEYAGITPMRYVAALRIAGAAHLIANHNVKITDTAFEYGFDSLEVFERSFKKYYGKPAVEYRKAPFAEPFPFYLSAKIYYERLRNMQIDNGTPFDWGKTAKQYGVYRNIYPSDFFDNLHRMGVCSGKILDIGTGTGILPFNMAKFSGEFIGIDISSEMTEQAKKLCTGIPNVSFLTADAHSMPFGKNTFDTITALQCWVYFDKEKLIPELLRVLKPKGKLFIAFMTWLPEEDEVIRSTFSLVRKYNPDWSGYMQRFVLKNFDYLKKYFNIEETFKMDYHLPFTKESWCGRMTASRGIGAALDNKTVECFKNDLMNMPYANELSLLHEAVIIKMEKRREYE